MKKITKIILFFLFFISNDFFAENYNEKINSNNELFIGQINAPSYSKDFNQFTNYKIDFYLSLAPNEYLPQRCKLIINITFPDLPFDYSNRKLIFFFNKNNLVSDEIESPEEEEEGEAYIDLNSLKFIVKKYKEWSQLVIDNKINDYFKLIGPEVYNSTFFDTNLTSIDIARFAFNKQPNGQSYLILLFRASASKEDYFYNLDARWAEYYFNANQVNQLENLLSKDFLLRKINELENQKNIDELFN